MSTLLTRDGRIPKNKWVVMGYSGGRITSRHQFKSAAMDRALTVARRTGQKQVVCEIGVDARGVPALWMSWSTERESF